MSYGAFIATIFYRYLEKCRFKLWVIISFFLIGAFLIYWSSDALILLSKTVEINLFKDVAFYNYLFIRLGNVLILFGLFYFFEDVLNRPLIIKIGQKTLSIYVIHFIIIYGSFTGLGLNQIIGKALNPLQAIIGALVFLTAVCFLSFYYAKPNVFVYHKIKKFIDKQKDKSYFKP